MTATLPRAEAGSVASGPLSRRENSHEKEHHPACRRAAAGQRSCERRSGGAGPGPRRGAAADECHAGFPQCQYRRQRPHHPAAAAAAHRRRPRQGAGRLHRPYPPPDLCDFAGFAGAAGVSQWRRHRGAGCRQQLRLRQAYPYVGLCRQHDAGGYRRRRRQPRHQHAVSVGARPAGRHRPGDRQDGVDHHPGRQMLRAAAGRCRRQDPGGRLEPAGLLVQSSMPGPASFWPSSMPPAA